MRKVIKRKLYDTEKAKFIGMKTSGVPGTNDWVSETLLRKITGEFFLFGQGGEGTKYSVLGSDNTWQASEKIIPLTFEKAKEWARQNLSESAYESTFENNTNEETMVGFKLPVPLAKKLEDYATKTGRSKSDIMRKMIEEL